MPTYRNVVRMPYTTGIPGDVAINVFHSTAPSVANNDNFLGDLVVMYHAIDGVLLSNILDAGANKCSITSYDLGDPEPRAPVSELFFTLTPSSGGPLPPEASMCLSFQGVRVSGERQARRRGRVFIGPLTGGLVASIGGRIQTADVDALAAAAGDLLDASQASGAYDWVIWSEVDQQAVVVDNGWVDNEFDVQRRRQQPATYRAVFD